MSMLSVIGKGVLELLKKKNRTLLIGIIVCIVLSGSLVLGGYKVSKITYTVSGSVEIGGVTMKGLPGNPVTNANGYYTVSVDYGWNGVVEPTKVGYTFEPPNRTYTKVVSDQDNQSYSATIITLTISGSTGIAGAVLDGLPGNPVTDQSGRYTATVNYGWTGTVVPVKDGCVFTPSSKQYNPVSKDQPNNNYTSKLKRFTVSGSTGIDDVIMEGLPGNPVTRGGGLYAATVDYGWKGIVTPQKEGYTFEPVDRSYSKIVGNYANQAFSSKRITLLISGTTGKSGVVMKGLPGNPVSNSKGRYAVTVDYGFSGTVTPTKAGYEFKPARKTYAKVTKKQDHQDYSAELLSYIVSGRIAASGKPLSGVVLKGFPGDPVTNESGYYSTIVDYGWKGLIEPSKEGYNFKPATRVYNTITNDLENQTYDAELLTYAISGVVKDAGMPVVGAMVSTQNGIIFGITNSKGEYIINVNYGFSGIVTASKEEYAFQDGTKSYDFVSENQTNQDFGATLKTFTVSGNIGEGGVIVEGLPGDPVTDENGYYISTVNYGFSGIVKPTKEGYTFSPSSRSYSKVTSDQSNQSYNADILTFTISGSVGVSGVEVSADNGGGSVTTDSSGNYSITVPYGWSGAITPEKEGYLFDPAFIEYTNVKSNIIEGGEESIDEGFIEEFAPVTENSVFEEPAVEESVFEEPAVSTPVAKVPGYETSVFESPFDSGPRVKGGQILINNIFTDADLRQVLQYISSQAGITIIPDQTVEGLVSCELTDVVPDKALEIVFAGTDYVVKKTPDYYLVSSPKAKEGAFLSSSQTKSVKLNFIDADTATKLLSPAFNEYVQADLAMGAVVITAPSALIERIESDLQMVDYAPHHVILDARIVVISNSDLPDLGVEWGWPKIKASLFSDSDHHGSGSSVNKWPWGVQIGYTAGALFTDSVEMPLNLLEQNGEATTVSSPQILAQNGKPAEIRVTTEGYYSLTPSIVEGQSSSNSRCESEKIEYGTVLNIVPHIGRNGDITLGLAIEISDVSVCTNNYPIVTRRVINTTMRIKDGGTVTVAGLKKKESSKNNVSAPGLSKVPLLGGLFKSKSNTEASQEVAIFITARLIRDPSVRIPPVENVKTSSPSQQSEQIFMQDLENRLTSN